MLLKKLEPRVLVPPRKYPLVIKYPLRKNQPVKAGSAGSLLAWPIRGQVYNTVTDNANASPSPLTAPGVDSPLTLPEYLVEVW